MLLVTWYENYMNYNSNNLKCEMSFYQFKTVCYKFKVPKKDQNMKNDSRNNGSTK